MIPLNSEKILDVSPETRDREQLLAKIANPTALFCMDSFTLI